MNPNWTRWIISSIAQYFKNQLDPLPLWIQGTPRFQDGLTDYGELQFVGPDWTETTQSNWTANIAVNIMLVSKSNLQNAFTLINNVGKTQAAFTDIALYDYDTDPPTFVACMQFLSGDIPERLRAQILGKIRPDVDADWAYVEGQFKVNLKE